jgi:hypothetical protein
MTDLHTHGSPSLLPRHGDDLATVAAERAAGFTTVVLKAHEGSTVERAALAGGAAAGVYGGIVLNSPFGGANPDAVEVAARLGGRVVWMPTVSSRTHKAGAASPELSVHRGFELQAVDVLGAAREHGVQRLLVNHPKMAFLRWNDEAAAVLYGLGAHLELGILPDLLGDADHASLSLTATYPSSLLVFGGDLGHADHPGPSDAVGPWLVNLERAVGADIAETIMTTQTRSLLT